MKQAKLLHRKPFFFLPLTYFTSPLTTFLKMPKFTPDQIADFRTFFTILANIKRRHEMEGNEIRAGPHKEQNPAV